MQIEATVRLSPTTKIASPAMETTIEVSIGRMPWMPRFVTR